MSGHSKWSKIKRAKASTDARRGKTWSKIARRIIMAAKAGGPNPEENLHLRYAVEEGRKENMPNDTIQNAIKKGSGESGGANYEEVLYEGYGTDGVAVMCECLTDNRHRTAPELRKIFENAAGQLGNSGCVAWMFHQKGSFTIEADKIEEDRLMELALEAGADDVVLSTDTYEVTCEPSDFAAVKQALAEADVPTVEAAITRVPANALAVSDPAKARRILRLMDALDSHDDVQHVYANFDIPDEIVGQLED